MAILTVGPTSTHASIAAALAVASAGDTISLEAGYSNETVTISLNGLTVDGSATSTGIVLQLDAGVALFNLIGEAPIAILDGPDGNGIVGNDGDNVITVSSGVDAVNGGAGIDRLVVDYSLATGSVTGNSTSNFTEAGGGGRSVVITDGTIENFTVLTGAAADTVTTGDGNDLINVGAGANTVTTGGGNNTLTGGANADTFTVGDGDNLINAGDGANTIIAGQGVNTIIGGNDADVITALDGGNVIEGGDGTNVLTSGDGADTITSGDGAATIVAGGGSDLITLRGGASTVDAGMGTDRMVLDYTAMITDITGGITSGNILTGYSGHIEDAAANSVDFVAVENLTILAGSGNDAIVTGDGADVMQGNDGNDTLTSGDGDDSFTGGAGDDALNGGAGIDTAFYSGARSDYTITFDIGGNPILVVDNRGGSPDGTDVLTGFELANFALNSLPSGDVIITGTPTEDQILTASNTLVDADGMGAVSYQWQSNGADIAGATNATFTLTQAEVGTVIGVVASYIDGSLNAESAAATAGIVANLNDLPTGLVTITGTAAEDQILTAGNTLADADGMGVVSYQWQADGVDIAGATGATLTLAQAQVGTAITVVASYTDQQGADEAVASDPTTPVGNIGDAPTGLVTITGTATEDQILTASNSLADEDGMGVVSYQWQSNGANIAGATGDTLTLGQAQVGTTITVVASYTDGQGADESVPSTATTAVANINDAPTGLVTITGTPSEGEILTASNALADEDGMGAVSYQWQADGVDIAGATAATFTLTQAQLGAAITVLANYIDQQLTDESVASDPTTPVANINDAPTGTVLISGTPTEDQILTASNMLTDVDGMGVVSYQWQSNGTNIAGATGNTLTLGQAQVGTLITVVASYTDGQGADESVPSAATTAVVNVNDLPTGLVTIVGTPAEGQTLTATGELNDEDGLGAISAQWRADGVDIAGANGETFTLTQAQVGTVIDLVLSYTDGQGTPEQLISTPTTVVGNGNDAPTGSVTITGTPTEDQVLTASNTLADEDGMGVVSYQWQSNGANIAGATGNTLTLGQAQVGTTISVVASYTDGQGADESVPSTATTAVANINDLPTGSVTVTGMLAEGELLTAGNTLADEDGLGTFSYEWRADGVAIAGATNASFTITAAQLGTAVNVVISYTDQQGTDESAFSTPAAIAAPPGMPFFQYTLTETSDAGQTEATAYDGPVAGLIYEFAGSANNEAVFGTTGNDFMHLGGGDDAGNGGDGDDVIDGGTGSNFLTGGDGRDIFFLDGRNGETTWSTITDWQAGEELALWGWVEGSSTATWLADAGAEGYRGVTMHADIDNNGIIDTSVTWAGLTQADLPVPTQHEGLLWFA